MFKATYFSPRLRLYFFRAGFSSMSDSLQCQGGRNYQVVVAATREMGIGKEGQLPWPRLPSDLKFFKELTTTTADPRKQNAVVMGRKTWESIPLQSRPLPARLNVVLTRTQSTNIRSIPNGVVRCESIPSALQLLAHSPYSCSIEKVFVIGGGQIFRETLNSPGCEAIHITEIDNSFQCDTFIPPIDLSCFQLWNSSQPLLENGIRFSFATYVRKPNSNGQVKSNGSSNSNHFTLLPRMILERQHV